MLKVRPKVAELAFQLYGRPLHSGVVSRLESCSIERGGYTAKIDITGAGHVVRLALRGADADGSGRLGPAALAQDAAAALLQPEGRRSDRVECRGGVSYQMSSARAGRARGLLDL